SELLLCHGMVCVVGRMRDLILQLSKSSIYSTKPPDRQKNIVRIYLIIRSLLTWFLKQPRLLKNNT
ncbi:hypothetical protein MP857_03265, partial [Escherichia coli]|nr:hypothetical protein [Escherichia coli]